MKNTLETKIEKTNGLSRRLDCKLDTEKNNKNQILIKEQWIYNLAKVVIIGLEVDIIEKMKTAREKDEEVVKVVEEIKNAEVKVLREDE